MLVTHVAAHPAHGRILLLKAAVGAVLAGGRAARVNVLAAVCGSRVKLAHARGAIEVLT